MFTIANRPDRDCIFTLPNPLPELVVVVCNQYPPLIQQRNVVIEKIAIIDQQQTQQKTEFGLQFLQTILPLTLWLPSQLLPDEKQRAPGQFS